MGMSTHVVGFRQPDAKWQKMKDAWDACEDAGVPIPEAVSDFFDGENPEDSPGMTVSLGSALTEWSGNSRGGYEVNITKLPIGLKIIRFFNAY